jgi:hypothetical protein
MRTHQTLVLRSLSISITEKSFDGISGGVFSLRLKKRLNKLKEELMKKGILLSLLIFAFAVPSYAKVEMSAINNMAVRELQTLVSTGLNWKVGDTLNFNLAIQELSLTGTVVVQVTKVDSSGDTMTEDVDLGQYGKENIVAVIDPNTGKIISLTVNGQPQTPPTSNPQIISQSTTKITVPAGTFDCIDAVIQDGQQQEEVWVNPTQIPITGMLKQSAKQNGMTVVMELTSFKHGS